MARDEVCAKLKKLISFFYGLDGAEELTAVAPLKPLSICLYCGVKLN